MSKKGPTWFKHVDDGYLLPYSPDFVGHPKLVEVSDREAFPTKRKPSRKSANDPRRKKLDAQVELFGDDVPPEEGEHTNPELNVEASRGLPR